MKRLLVGSTLALAGCEGCDFSFGPIPLTVHVTPEDVDATVVICDDEGDDAPYCQTYSTQHDTGTQTYTYAATPPADGTIQTSAGWDGYAVCKYPELEVDVTAPGCEPVHLTVPKHKPEKNEHGIQLDVKLKCG